MVDLAHKEVEGTGSNSKNSCGGVPGGAAGTNLSRPSRAVTPTLPMEARLLSAACMRAASVAVSPRSAELKVAAMSNGGVTSPLKPRVKEPAVASVPLSRTICTSYSCAWLTLVALGPVMASLTRMPRLLTG